MTKPWSFRRFFWWLIILYIAFSLGAAYGAFRGPRHLMPDCSPPPMHLQQRSGLNFNDHGAWWGRFFKMFRPSLAIGELTMNDFLGPPFALTLPLHYFFGWDILDRNAELEGIVEDTFVSFDDGDTHFVLSLLPPYEHFAYRPGHPEDKTLRRRYIDVEVDEFYRDRFPVVRDIKIGDVILVRGRHVFDRPHGQVEIHPPSWIEIRSHWCTESHLSPQ